MDAELYEKPSSVSVASNYLPNVKEQYEDYPYPPRDPLEEKKFLLMPNPDMPERLNHYCFGGKQTFSKGFRILVAGAGTGDSTIYMAEQYGSLGAEIVHLDLSNASINIARERARLRGIEKKITFLQASLLDLPTMNLGKFDYICCAGVLHHLANPEEGLKALTSVLAPEGVIAVMVYGKYGRLAIYPMQETFRILLKNIGNKADKIKYGRSAFEELPATNWYQFSKNWFSLDFGHDNGFYDLLLHPQDRSYDVAELYDFIASAGLKGISLQHDLSSGAHYYDPSRILTAQHLRAEIAKLSLQEQQILAELLSGNITTHTFYAAHEILHEPDPQDEAFIPCIAYEKQTTFKALTEIAIASTISTISYRNPDSNLLIELNLFPTSAAMMLAIDGQRTISEIIEIITARSDFKHNQVKEQFLQLYKDLRRHDLIFLRHSSVPAFDNPVTLQIAMTKRMGYPSV